ncbi:MAG: hypothetical protein SGI73_04085 [Chloroflexota bacterium]|nr:hypothetical protein [Chloroflexota bacterium]
MQEAAAQKWHVASWGAWGWAETLVKGVGIAAGIIALIGALSASTFFLGDNPRLAAVIVIGIMTLLLFGAVFIRLRQREVISMIFVILNVIGHAGIFIALLRQPDMRVLPIVFAIAFIAGELVKQRFLVVSGFTEAGQDTSGMVRFSRGIMLVYVVFLVFLLV